MARWASVTAGLAWRNDREPSTAGMIAFGIPTPASIVTASPRDR
jgi:hypothetical protein